MGVADFEAKNKEDNTLNGKLTKNIYEQVPVGVTFYMTNKLGNASYFESFGKQCLKDFVETLVDFKKFKHNFLKS